MEWNSPQTTLDPWFRFPTQEMLSLILITIEDAAGAARPLPQKSFRRRPNAISLLWLR